MHTDRHSEKPCDERGIEEQIHLVERDSLTSFRVPKRWVETAAYYVWDRRGRPAGQEAARICFHEGCREIFVAEFSKFRLQSMARCNRRALADAN